MRLTQEVDYAFRIVSYLMQRPHEIVGANVISEDMHIPLRFCLKILRKLNLAGITNSRRGARGGYMLLDPDRVITYYEVVEAIQGPVTINRCLYDDAYCVLNAGDAHCDVHKRLDTIQRRVREALQEETFVPIHKQ